MITQFAEGVKSVFVFNGGIQKSRIFCQNLGFSPNQRYECHLGVPRIIFVRIAEDTKSEAIEWLWKHHRKGCLFYGKFVIILTSCFGWNCYESETLFRFSAPSAVAEDRIKWRRESEGDDTGRIAACVANKTWHTHHLATPKSNLEVIKLGKHHNIQSGTDWINNIVTFNGQGCSGKTTQVKLLANSNKEEYKRIHSYKLRRKFKKKIYEKTEGMNTDIKYLNESGTCKKLYSVEVSGHPSFAWLIANFYKTAKPLMLEGTTVVLDHYLGDYYADMLACVDIADLLSLVREDLVIPDFDQGTHFYLDIDYEIYQERWREREGTEPRVNRETFKKRRERYQELCELTPLKCIDAKVSKEEVAKKVQEVLACENQ